MHSETINKGDDCLNYRVMSKIDIPVCDIGSRKSDALLERSKHTGQHVTIQLLDSLQDAGVFDDDEQIDQINIYRGTGEIKGGSVRVLIWVDGEQ